MSRSCGSENVHIPQERQVPLRGCESSSSNSQPQKQALNTHNFNLPKFESHNLAISGEHQRVLSQDRGIIGYSVSLSQDIDVQHGRSTNKASFESLHSRCTASTKTSRSSLRDFSSCPPSASSESPCLSVVQPVANRVVATSLDDIFQLERSFQELEIYSVRNTEDFYNTRCPANHTEPSNKSSKSSTNDGGTFSAAQGNKSQAFQRTNDNKRSPDDHDDDGDDHNDKRRRNDSLPSDSNEQVIQKGYACPFAKRSPDEHGDCNRFQKMYDVARVKQHLNRKHGLLFCDLCHAYIGEDPNLKEAHINNGLCIGGSQSAHQERPASWKTRSRKNAPQSESWFSLYKRLFPGEILPDSPFVDGLYFEASDFVNILQFAVDTYPDFQSRLSSTQQLEEGTRSRAIQCIESLLTTRADSIGAYPLGESPIMDRVGWKGVRTVRKGNQRKSIARPSLLRQARPGVVNAVEQSQADTNASQFNASTNFSTQTSTYSSMTSTRLTPTRADWPAADSYGALPTPPYHDPFPATDTHNFVNTVQNTNQTYTRADITHNTYPSMMMSSNNGSMARNIATTVHGKNINRGAIPNQPSTQIGYMPSRATIEQNEGNPFQPVVQFQRQPHLSQQCHLGQQLGQSAQSLYAQGVRSSPYTALGPSQLQNNAYGATYPIPNDQIVPYPDQYTSQHTQNAYPGATGQTYTNQYNIE